MTNNYTLSVFTENRVGMLQRLSVIFTRRHVNIESITASESEVKNVFRYSIVVHVTEDMAKKLNAQLSKQVEVLRAFYHRSSEVVAQEIALYKISGTALNENEAFNSVLHTYNARILNFSPEYIVVEKTGNAAEIHSLFHQLKSFGMLEFARSGQVAVTKPMKTLTEYLME